MTNLSPKAQAVLDAFNHEARPEPHHQREAIAAVLRAAATNAKEPLSINDLPEQQKHWYRLGVDNFRRKLNAIANELENHQFHNNRRTANDH